MKKGKEAYDLVRQIDEYPKTPKDILGFFVTVFSDRIPIKHKELQERWQSQQALDELEDFLQQNWAQRSVLYIELYTDMKNPELETVVETVLELHGIFYGKSEVWIDSEKPYEVLYEMEV